MRPVKITGDVKSDWSTTQQAFLADHCPLTGRYFEPWLQLMVSFF
jgi:hypothetical protein